MGKSKIRLAMLAVLVASTAVGVVGTAREASATHTVYSPTGCEAGDQGNGSQGWTERTCTKGGEITAYYRFMLGRDPDPNGFKGWMKAPGNDLSDLRNALHGVAASIEADIRFGSNNGWWLSNLYWAAFDRASELPGYDDWLDQLNAGTKTRSQVAWDFALGLEFLQRSNSMSNNFSTERYVEADWYVGGIQPSRTFHMHYLHFNSWKVFRQAADSWDTLNWSDDGCSVPITGQFVFGDSSTCLRHDFGWRNFGNGLQIERTNARKFEIDHRLHDDIDNSCQANYAWWDPRRAACHFEADVVEIAVGNYGW